MKFCMRTIVYTLYLSFSVLMLSSCFSSKHIRHISSDVSLIAPHKTTQQELLSFMGLPQEKRTVSDTEEEWLYYQANKSLMRRTPMVGKKLGEEDYDVAIIRFTNGVVTYSQYRSLTAEEFKQLRVTNSVP